MSAIEDLRERHEKEIEELQSNCEHKQTTIMPFYWAIAHYAGYDVEVCDECGKTLREIRKDSLYTSESITTFSSYYLDKKCLENE